MWSSMLLSALEMLDPDSQLDLQPKYRKDMVQRERYDVRKCV